MNQIARISLKVLTNQILNLEKFGFFMPELQGASRRGRFMYVVHQASCSVYPVWVYTHEEYPKRPSDHDLKEQLTIIEMNIVESPPS